MARFQYRMQNILDIKLKLEEQAKNEYAIARGKLDEEEKVLADLNQRKKKYEEINIKLKQEKISISDLIENYQAIDTMEHLITDQIQKKKKAEELLETKRQELQAVMQERKTHDKLKEKAFEQFVKDENARESKEIDELTSYSYGKNKE